VIGIEARGEYSVDVLRNVSRVVNFTPKSATAFGVPTLISVVPPVSTREAFTLPGSNRYSQPATSASVIFPDRVLLSGVRDIRTTNRT